MAQGADGNVGQARESLGEKAQDHALAAARIAVDHGEAALVDLSLLDAPAKALHLGRHEDRLGGQFGGEGIELQPIEGEQFLAHVGSLSGVGR